MVRNRGEYTVKEQTFFGIKDGDTVLFNGVETTFHFALSGADAHSIDTFQDDKTWTRADGWGIGVK